MTEGEQYTLALAPPRRDPQDSFAEGRSNRAARATLAQWRHWPSGVMALVGPARSGKTHLASAWATTHGAIVFPASVWARAPHLVLAAGPEQAVVLEDADSTEAGGGEALYALINAARRSELAAGLVTARTRPSSWSLSSRALSADVRSRITHLPFVEMDDPDDEELRQVIRTLFSDRGVTISERVVNYLITRMERSHGAAYDLVEALDQRSLADKTRITQRLAAQVLEEEQDP